MAKRGANEGSVYRRRDGRWVATIDLGWEGGKRKRKSFYAGTRNEVSQKLTKALRDHQRGLRLAPENLKVSDYLQQWLDAVRSTVRAKTYTRYEQYVRLHLTPTIGHRLLGRLTPQHVAAAYAAKLQEGLSPTSVAHMHTILHGALEQAVRWDLVARNVAKLVTKPRMQRREMSTLTPDEARHFLAVAARDRLEALYVLALTSGMRQGELLGLRWKDVDLGSHTLKVVTSLQRTQAGFEFAEPKTSRSRRNISLTATAVEALGRHRTQQLAERLVAGPNWDDHDLVFSNTIGRPLEAGSVLRRSFWPLLAEAQLPRIRFHDLRHSAATLLLGRGVHPKVVAEMLGHSSTATTLDTYSHVTPTMQEQATQHMDALLQA